MPSGGLYNSLKNLVDLFTLNSMQALGDQHSIVKWTIRDTKIDIGLKVGKNTLWNYGPLQLRQAY